MQFRINYGFHLVTYNFVWPIMSWFIFGWNITKTKRIKTNFNTVVLLDLYLLTLSGLCCIENWKLKIYHDIERERLSGLKWISAFRFTERLFYQFCGNKFWAASYKQDDQRSIVANWTNKTLQIKKRPKLVP